MRQDPAARPLAPPPPSESVLVFAGCPTMVPILGPGHPVRPRRGPLGPARPGQSGALRSDLSANEIRDNFIRPAAPQAWREGPPRGGRAVPPTPHGRRADRWETRRGSRVRDCGPGGACTSVTGGSVTGGACIADRGGPAVQIGLTSCRQRAAVGSWHGGHRCRPPATKEAGTPRRVHR